MKKIAVVFVLSFLMMGQAYSQTIKKEKSKNDENNRTNRPLHFSVKR